MKSKTTAKIAFLTAAVLLFTIISPPLTARAADLPFTDNDSIQYTEAIEKLVSLGAIGGFEDGTFRPKDTLTRAQACKILSLLYDLRSDSAVSPFDDIAGHWAEDYIMCCASLGIIGGYGNRMFGPDDPVTGDAWSKMLLCAVGFDAEAAGMAGTDWAAAVGELAINTDLQSGMTADYSSDEPIKREEACQLAFNSIENGLFREKVVSDLELALAAYNDVLKAYEETMQLSRDYIASPTDENRTMRVAAVQKNLDLAEEKMKVTSGLTEADNEILERFNVPVTDHQFLFESLPIFIPEIMDWAGAVVIIIKENAVGSGIDQHVLTWRQNISDMYKVWLTYGIMDYAAYLNAENNAYVRGRLYTYTDLVADDVEWLYDHDAISAASDARMTEIERIMDEEGEYLQSILDELEDALEELEDLEELLELG